MSSQRERRLALIWHVVEFMGLLGLVGLIWSYRHLNPPIDNELPEYVR